MAKKIPIRDDFPSCFFDELGRLVVAAGRVEYVLKLCLKQLRGQGFSAGMLEAEELRQLSCLCDKVKNKADQVLKGQQRKDLHALIAEIKRIGGQRNDMVHALWTTNDDREPLRIRPQLRKGCQTVDWSKSKPVPISELRQLRRQLEEAHAALQCQRKTWK